MTYRALEEVSGLGPAAAKQLREAFVTTAELLAVQNPTELIKNKILGEAKAKTLIRNARILCGMHGFKSGLVVEEEMEASVRLTTGLERLDEQLFGGIESGSLVELYGPARGGKTQWSAYLAVRSMLPENQGGLAGKVLWIDTEDSFKPWTIRAIAMRFGLDPEVALGSIGRADIIDSGQIEDLFESIPSMCAKDGYKLVVIDSFSGLFRQEYTGLQTLRIRQQDMNTRLNQMRRVCKATKAIFVYTNQVMAKISNYGGYDGAPIGGHIMSHASDYRFQVNIGKDDERHIKLKDNAGLPEFKVTTRLGWGGFYPDAKSKKETAPDIIEKLKASGKAGFIKALIEVEEKASSKKTKAKMKKKKEVDAIEVEPEVEVT